MWVLTVVLQIMLWTICLLLGITVQFLHYFMLLLSRKKVWTVEVDFSFKTLIKLWMFWISRECELPGGRRYQIRPPATPPGKEERGLAPHSYWQVWPLTQSYSAFTAANFVRKNALYFQMAPTHGISTHLFIVAMWNFPCNFLPNGMTQWIAKALMSPYALDLFSRKGPFKTPSQI